MYSAKTIIMTEVLLRYSSRGNHRNPFRVPCPDNFYYQMDTTLMRYSEVSKTKVFRDHKLRGNRQFCWVNIFLAYFSCGDRNERFFKRLSSALLVSKSNTWPVLVIIVLLCDYHYCCITWVTRQFNNNIHFS